MPELSDDVNTVDVMRCDPESLWPRDNSHTSPSTAAVAGSVRLIRAFSELAKSPAIRIIATPSMRCMGENVLKSSVTFTSL